MDMTRAEMIGALVNRDLDADDYGELIHHLVTYGTKGYYNMTDEELRVEYIEMLRLKREDAENDLGYIDHDNEEV